MRTIRFLFEGTMEQEALPKLLGPMFQGRSVRVQWSRRYRGRDEVLKSIPKLARAMCSSAADVHLFALFDYHPRLPKWHTPDDLVRGVAGTVDRHLRKFTHIHLAMHDIESWILCDRRQLATHLSCPEDRFGQQAEEMDLDNPPKRVIHELFRRSGKQYRETAEGIELLANLSISNVYERCRYFKTFLDDLAQTSNLDLTPILGERG